MKTRFNHVAWLLIIALTSAYAELGEPSTRVKTDSKQQAESFPTQIMVTLSPPEAVAAGARWKFNTETLWRDSGVFYTNLQTGVYLLEFAPISGWLTPVWDHAIVVTPESTINVSVSYSLLPLFPLDLSTSRGGYVRARSQRSPPWMGSIDIPEPDDLKSTRWEAAVNLPGTFDFIMPHDNSNYRMQLWALAYPNYQFIGWSGDVSSMRNPITIIMNGPMRLQANFARASGGGYSAILAGDDYCSPGPLSLHGQVNYPVGQQLRSLRWHPILDRRGLVCDQFNHRILPRDPDPVAMSLDDHAGCS